MHHHHRAAGMLARYVLLLLATCVIVGWPVLLPAGLVREVVQVAWWGTSAFWLLVVLAAWYFIRRGRRIGRHTPLTHPEPFHPRNERLYTSSRR
jgi:hypothetical protein